MYSKQVKSMRCNIMNKIRKSCNNKSHKKTTNKEYTIQELMELGEKTNQLKLAESIKEDKDKNASTDDK